MGFGYPKIKECHYEKKSISIEQLQKADIILSTTPDRVSKIVKLGTASKYSHARLVQVGPLVIEAVDPQVKRSHLNELLLNDKYAAVYRMPKLTNGQKITIMTYAAKQLEKKHDLSGAIGSAKLSRTRPIGAAMAAENALNPEKEFYCSELVAFAYKYVGIRLSDRPYSQATPEALARSTKLVYVGHLKK